MGASAIVAARDAAKVRLRRVPRIPAGLGDGGDLLRVARGEDDLVAVVPQHAGEGRSPRARSDDGDVHVEVMKSMETGTPSSPKRSRSWFSTQ